ncbi:MAG: hypothetical protein JO112_02420 [Planctomycetes bacterium]|nr:hypothetical protein [Planctomycetota bacterium]
MTIVSANPIRDDMANGVFLRSLFAGWPRDRLSQIYFPVATGWLPNLPCCHDYRMIRISGRVQRVQENQSGQISFPAANRTASSSPRLVSLLGRASLRRPRVFRWFKLIQEAWYAYSWIGKVLERELQALRPEIVYALLGNYCLTRITCLACERLGFPLYLHITDDFIHSLYADIPFRSFFQAASNRWARRTMNYASGRAGISPVMAEEYATRYGADWSWFATLVDSGAYDPTPRANPGPVKLVFAGNLGLQRWSTLRQLALALQELRQKQAIDSRLLIYTSPDQARAYHETLNVSPITELRGWIPPTQLPGIFHDADILVHVESFDSTTAAYTQLSLSTKISQYMMAARCILGVGPEQVASIQVINRAQAGQTLCEKELPMLAQALVPILKDEAFRQRCGENGRRWALRWLETDSGRERFRLSLLQAMQRFSPRQAA